MCTIELKRAIELVNEEHGTFKLKYHSIRFHHDMIALLSNKYSIKLMLEVLKFAGIEYELYYVANGSALKNNPEIGKHILIERNAKE